MKQPNSKRELKIRPLSEGIGLGNLKSTHSHAFKNVTSSPVQQNFPSMGASSRAQAAYKPHSVATQIRKRTSTVWFVHLSRFAAGLGLDLFVGSFTLFVFAWAGVLAWNLGSKGELNPLVSLLTITDTLERLSVMKFTMALVTAAIFWRASRFVFLKQQVA